MSSLKKEEEEKKLNSSVVEKPRDWSKTKVILHEDPKSKFLIDNWWVSGASNGRLNHTLTDRWPTSITRVNNPKSVNLQSEKSEKAQEIEKFDEEEEKKLIAEDPMRKRIFIHVA